MKNTKINDTVVQIMFFFMYLLCSRVRTTTAVATSGFCLRNVKGLRELNRQEKSFHLCSNYFCRLNEHNFFERCSLFLEDSKVSAEES